jgi:hypothetical protein
MRAGTFALVLLLPALAGCGSGASSNRMAAADDGNQGDSNAIYPTYGTHNPPSYSPCASADCRYARGPNEPKDPQYPAYWQSRWNMYRVFNNYQQYPPPYNGAPPAPLKAGADYEVSQGATYYDSTWGKGDGAMMEYYEKRCLPIFPDRSNHFTCAFISLGDTAYFLTYPQDRPKGMPPVCLFSPLNHPPRRDFIAHLPYATSDSARLGAGAQAYSFWVSASDGKPIQTGASPDRTADEAILFGYAFAPVNGQLQPQSFYFSGVPSDPPNAPIVSQNYTDWAPTQPDPAKTWNQVSGLDPKKLPACEVMSPPPPTTAAKGGRRRGPSWLDIGRWPKRTG